MRFVLFVTALLFMSGSTGGQGVEKSENRDSTAPSETIWNDAGEAYVSGNYEQASLSYERILKEYGESFEVYYNLGNAYFKQNMQGPARLNYERALRLDPGNEDILHNIEFAKAMQSDRIDEIKELVFTKWLDNAAGRFSPETWATTIYALLAALLTLIMLFVFSSTTRTKKLSLLGACLLSLIMGASFFLGTRNRNLRTSNDQAIIYKPVVTVKSAPDLSGADLFIIHEGLKVKVIESQTGWIRIMLYDGKSQGWIPKESLQII